MMVFLSILAVLVCVFVCYLFALRGRVGHENAAPMAQFLYAHRGYHDKPSVPENSLAAFRRALAAGYGVEFDVHLLADGGLAVIHDADLSRTTGQEGKVETLTTADLPQYFLEGTQETIPTFVQVLDVFAGETPLIIELKTEGDNFAALCEATCNALADYKGLYCIESFDPRCVAWLKRNRPDIMRGQLSCNFFAEETTLSFFEAFGLTYLFGNVLSRPDFIAYDFNTRGNLSNLICRDVWHLTTANWTIRTQEDLDCALREGALAIFEQFAPEEL